MLLAETQNGSAALQMCTWTSSPPLLPIAAPYEFHGAIRDLEGYISHEEWVLLSERALEDANGR